jgi:hypothetical protein
MENVFNRNGLHLRCGRTGIVVFLAGPYNKWHQDNSGPSAEFTEVTHNISNFMSQRYPAGKNKTMSVVPECLTLLPYRLPLPSGICQADGIPAAVIVAGNDCVNK